MAMTLTTAAPDPTPDPLDHLPPYAKVAQVAEVLNMSLSTVYRLCEEGEIDSVKIGGNVRIVTASLRSRLAGQ